MATPSNPNRPIPNGPFSYPETWYLQSALGPIITGSGLSVDPALGVLYATGGGGGGGNVNLLLAGPGIALNPAGGTGNVTICNSGVINVTAGPGISVASSAGTYTISSSATGTVTSIIAGAGLTGGVITNAGTIALNTACVIPPTAFSAKGQLLAGTSAGTYSALAVGASPNGYVLTTDSTQATGMRWCAACTGTVTSVSGTAPVVVTTGTTTPVISVQAGTTAAAGVVQLVNNTTTSDASKALTAAQGYALQQQINGLLAGGGLTLAGTFNATTGQMATVTTAGTSASFVVGSNIPAAAAGNKDLFVIVTTGGVYTPPGAGTSVNASQGDWLLSTGTAWQYLNTGYDAPAASTSIPGIVQLATTAQTQTGTDTNTAVTPAGAAATYVPLSLYPTKGSIAAGGATACTPVSQAAGTDGQVLTACAACASGLTWVTPASGTTLATPTVAGTVFGKVDTANGNESVGCNSLAALTTGYGNVALGQAAGLKVTSGNTNTLIGPASGCEITSGVGNVAAGFNSLNALTTGGNNTAIGTNAGTALTIECGNTILGNFAGTAGCTNNVWIANGAGNVRIQVNCLGALSVSGSGFGTAGQVLQSQGDALPPTWGSATTAAATPTALGTVIGTTPNSTTTTGLGIGLCAGGTTDTCVNNRCGNVSIGYLAGSCQGLAAAGDGFNTFIGQCAGARNCGTYNILIGNKAGSCFIGSEARNLIIGSNGFTFAGCTDMFLLASPAVEVAGTNSGAPFIYGNACGAIAFRTAAATLTIDGCYGANCQFLMSRGAANSPTWSALPIASRTLSGTVRGCADLSGCGDTYLGFCTPASISGAPGGYAANTLIGSCIGQTVFFRSGSCNVVIGARALPWTSAAVCGNVFIGSDAAGCNCAGVQSTTGNCNVAIGNAVWSNWSGTGANFNVIIGAGINPPSVNGSCQLAIGHSSFGAPVYWLTGCPNGNIRPGYGILDRFNSAGSDGQYLSATGTNALEWRNISIAQATAVVPGTILGFTTSAVANENTALGLLAGGDTNPTSANGNTAVGRDSMWMNGACCSGECFNTAVGAHTLAPDYLTGCYSFNVANTALGYCAGTVPNTANDTVSVACNVYVGFCAGYARASGSKCNTVVGATANSVSSPSGCNNTLLGFNAQTSTATSSNQIVLGNGNNTVIRANVTTITALSDARDKKDVAPLSTGLDFIKDLKPVTFKWDHRDPEVTARRGFPDMGFIAQDLLETELKHGTKNHTQLVHDANPDQLEASYGRLIPVLVKAIQDLSAEVDRLKAKLGE
jgi:hypothetical protein